MHCASFKAEKVRMQHQVEDKTQKLKDAALQFVAMKHVIQRNQATEKAKRVDEKQIVQLPFLMVKTKADTQITCEVCN